MNLAAALNIDLLKTNKLVIGVFIIYLFHISAIIGVTIGYESWFITKTPLNLLIMFAMLIWVFPLDSAKKMLAAMIFMMSGMVVEWLGVNYSLLFGTYEYGSNLGPKIGGVPLLIGINWAILVLVTGEISNSIKVSKWLKIFIGAALMVLLDFFMEVPAPVFDFWTFEGGVAPLSNYIAWFAIAAILHYIFRAMKIEGNFKFSMHLYICQFLFFAYFYGYYSV